MGLGSREMLERQRKREDVEVAEARMGFDQVLKRVTGADMQLVVIGDGMQVAAIVPIADFQRLARFDADERDALAIIEATQAPFCDVPPAQVEQAIVDAIAEVRAEISQQRETIGAA